jgi:hypothetical protein
MSQIKVYTALSNTMWCTDKCEINAGSTPVTYQVYATALGSAPAAGNIYSNPPAIDANSSRQIYVGVGNYITVTGSGYTAQEIGTQSSAQASVGNFTINLQVATSVSATTPQEILPADGLTAVDSMVLTPSQGTFQTIFTAEIGLLSVGIPNITLQGALDVENLAVVLAAYPGGVAHPLILGMGEIMTPGVYDISGAGSLNGILTIDAQNDPDAIFVIRCDGALNSGATSQVVLVNGANPARIFWRASGAVALGASTTFYGTALGVAGAASSGAGCYMIGRLLSTAGIVSIDGAQPLEIPPGYGPISIPLGVLQTFAMFGAAGAVASSGVSNVTGDIGTNAGPVAGFRLPTILNGTVYLVGSPGPANGPVDAEFGIYVNNVLIPSSTVAAIADDSIISATITSVADATVLPGQLITVKSLVNLGELTINARSLSISGLGCGG